MVNHFCVNTKHFFFVGVKNYVTRRNVKHKLERDCNGDCPFWKENLKFNKLQTLFQKIKWKHDWNQKSEISKLWTFISSKNSKLWLLIKCNRVCKLCYDTKLTSLKLSHTLSHYSRHDIMATIQICFDKFFSCQTKFLNDGFISSFSFDIWWCGNDII